MSAADRLARDGFEQTVRLRLCGVYGVVPSAAQEDEMWAAFLRGESPTQVADRLAERLWQGRTYPKWK